MVVGRSCSFTRAARGRLGGHRGRVRAVVGEALCHTQLRAARPLIHLPHDLLSLPQAAQRASSTRCAGTGTLPRTFDALYRSLTLRGVDVGIACVKTRLGDRHFSAVSAAFLRHQGRHFRELEPQQAASPTSLLRRCLFVLPLHPSPRLYPHNMSSGYGLGGGASMTSDKSLSRAPPNNKQAQAAASPSGKKCSPATSSTPTPKTTPARRNACPS